MDATTKDKTFLKRDAKTGAWSELTPATPVKDGTEATGVFTTGADGKIEMSGLPKGTYYVEEIKLRPGTPTSACLTSSLRFPLILMPMA